MVIIYREIDIAQHSPAVFISLEFHHADPLSGQKNEFHCVRACTFALPKCTYFITFHLSSVIVVFYFHFGTQHCPGSADTLVIRRQAE